MDGGGSPSTLADALGRRPLALRPAPGLAGGRFAAGAGAGRPAAQSRPVPGGAVLWAGNPDASYSAEQISHWLTTHATPVTPAFAGAVLDLGRGARLEVRSVSPRGAVLLVEWQGFRALLPVGMNFDTLAGLENGKKIGPVTMLLLADSGFAQVNPPEWIAALRPASPSCPWRRVTRMACPLSPSWMN